jgi:PAS domain S-box-containing protein
VVLGAALLLAFVPNLRQSRPLDAGLGFALLVAVVLLLSWKSARAADLAGRLRRLEERLFEGEDLLHKIMDATPNCVFIKDDKGKYLFVNKALAELYDASEDLMLGKTDRELADICKISAEEADRCKKEDEAVLSSGEPMFFLENCFTKKDGTKIWFQVKKVLFSSNTVSRAILGVSLDITQRKLMAEALRQSEEQYRVSIESSPYGILVADRRGNLLIFNSQLSKATGFSREDIPSFQAFLDNISPGKEYLQFPTMDAILAMTEKSSHSGEAQLVCRNGERRTFQYVASQRPSDSIMIYFNDVTLQKKMQESLQQAKKEERDRISREIHDTIGYTLTSLKMMMEAAIGLSAGISDALTDVLEQSRDQVQDALTETRVALHMLRAVQGDKLRGKEDIRRLVATFEKATGVMVEVDFGGVQWSYSGPVELILYRVIQEGLTNAFRHGRATQVQILLQEQDSGINLIVCDNGLGCKTIEEGIGLCGIRERVAHLGGRFLARNKPVGFELSVWVPSRAVE